MERTTADGHSVKRGDVVWKLHGYNLITRSKVTTALLKIWDYWRLSENTYRDEQVAIRVAIERARKQLSRAKQRARANAKAIERLTARLTNTPRQGGGGDE